jgi:orotate phosphoribosyltransferase
VDRQEGAEEQLKKMDVKMTAVTTVRAIVNTLYDAGLIDDNTLESVMKQMISQGDYENE